MDSRRTLGKGTSELIFLGTSGSIQVPAFFCSCPVCEEARKDPRLQRTRASLALVGEEVTVVDASPDFDLQMERQRIDQVDRIFITHWHYDHIAGLGGLGEMKSCAGWESPVHVYVPEEVADHFNRELAYLSQAVEVHPIKVGERIELPDATWEVVKTTHTDHSVGFIVHAARRFAYLVDSHIPPPDTVSRLTGLDFVILEATLDRKDVDWKIFTLSEAVDFWKTTNVPECMLTHLSCHGWREGKGLVPGLLSGERKEFENRRPGLRIAFDGMRIQA